MKKWFMFLFLIGGMSVGFAQYGSSSNQYNPYQSKNASQPYNQQQSMSSCDNLKSSDPEAYAFSQKLSPIHQAVFCQHFSQLQRKQAMALAGSVTQGLKGEQGAITPDMAVEVIMQAARYQQNKMQQQQMQMNQGENQTYPSQNQGSSRSKRYSNY